MGVQAILSITDDNYETLHIIKKLFPVVAGVLSLAARIKGNVLIVSAPQIRELIRIISFSIAYLYKVSV
jgi:hypothetical protein